MPTYTFTRLSTGETWEETMTISSMSEKLSSDKDLDVIPGATLYGDPVLQGRKKTDHAFNEILKEMKKGHKGSTIETW